MQDEVRDKSVALAIKVGKTGSRLTADLLKWAMRKYMVQSQNPKIHHGKQSVKQLVKQGQGVQNIEITDKNIKSFEHVAKRYGVDFAEKGQRQRQIPRLFQGQGCGCPQRCLCGVYCQNHAAQDPGETVRTPAACAFQGGCQEHDP